MIELRCKKCGSVLTNQEEIYICCACGARYEKESASSYTEELARILDEQKQEAVANLRMQLWREFNEKDYDLEEIKRLSRGIKSYLPDDFFANFCDFASERNSRSLNKFLLDTDVVKYRDYVWDMLNFLMRPLREKNQMAVNELLARIREAELDKDKFNYYNELLIKKSKELDKGVYDVTLPRDVFVAYSSEDMAEVEELVETLEEQKISCFVAARNLQHGAIQHYEEELKKAMDSCKTVVFVSSRNSRDRDCDALTVELAYIKKKDIEAAPGNLRNNYERMPKEYKKPRVEYLISEHKNTAGDRLVEEFFAGYEYCFSDAKELATRILRYITEQPSVAKPQKENVKYCVACGAENLKRTRFCSDCGGQEFVPTKEEYEERQRIKQERALREAEAVRKAEAETAKLRAELKSFRKAEEEKKKAEADRLRVEEERKKAEADRLRVEEEKKRSEAETAALRAELERLKAEIGKPKASIAEDKNNKIYRYTKSAEQGDACAQYNLGYCYSNGDGVAKDYKQAVYWFTKSAEQGYARAQCYLGYCYENGDGVAKDYKQAVYWYTKSAEQGNASAQFNLGLCYENGKGVARDYKQAVYWYTKSAEQGDASAQCNLGLCYKNGKGVARDYKQAVYWFTKSAEQGKASAQCNLGNCYYNGEGVARDYKQAVYWYTKSAKQGYARAQCNLGVCYDNGEGVARDYKQAVYWYTKSAEQGYARAQCIFGNCYYNGEGVARDYKQAVYWYTKSAEQGYARAQYNLGCCYYNGEGVARDYKQAVYWYTKSAEQGKASAQYNLGYCYENGNGVAKDYKQAVYWYTKSAEQGDENAKQALKKLKK